MDNDGLFVGIDVSAGNLDGAVFPNSDFWRVPNDANGIASLLERLVRLQPTLVVMEATGRCDSTAASKLIHP